MTTLQRCRGFETLVDRLDAAVSQPTTERIARGVQETLEELLGNGAVELPPEIAAPKADGYARRLLHRSRSPEYEVLAMIWGPGQGTPLHDHAGLWCVEGVLEGEIGVVQYDLEEEDGDRLRFSSQQSVTAGVGSAGSLIPPYEYHTIHNASGQTTAITVHVYGGEMSECTVFEPLGGGWFRRRTKNLVYD